MSIETYLSPDLAGATLTIDLGALCANYAALRAQAGAAECAAAVKGDAYGTGMGQTVTALSAAGCRTFFVAQVSEGAEVRATLPDAVIYVLNGLVSGRTQDYVELNLRPVLGNLDEITEWAGIAGAKPAAAVHIDTGINRLGLTEGDVGVLAQNKKLCDGFEWSLVMSHLACADWPDDPMNQEQLAAFDRLRAQLPPTRASLANSAGILNGSSYHLDLVRPGIALYGGNPHSDSAKTNQMRSVVALESHVLQVRDVAKGGGVGYGGAWRAERPSRIAIVPVGYFDGYFRSAFRPDAPDPAGVMIAGTFAPLAGRVSMDMITVDVTDIASDKVHRGARVELMGPNISVNDIARWSGTISYEVLTALGSRYARVYKNSSAEQ